MAGHPIVELIDEAYALAHEKGEGDFRGHLGASMIGRKCSRELWYGFRWAAKPKFSGRLLRLFNRGHLEEFRFIGYLESLGFEVRAYSQRLLYCEEADSYAAVDWDKEFDASFTDVSNQPAHIEIANNLGVELEQWRISDANGHFGGSLDGELHLLDGQWVPDIPSYAEHGPGLCEFKTHNTKSFTFLVQTHREAVEAGNGECALRKAKPEHWEQMQTYMGKRGLRWGLYLAVNKNDDDLYAEVIWLDPSRWQENVRKAESIIFSPHPPNRIGKHPSWYDCKFCDYQKICFYGEPLERHCRTCINVTPVGNGQWHCRAWDAIIPSDYILKGCDNYKMITD